MVDKPYPELAQPINISLPHPQCDNHIDITVPEQPIPNIVNNVNLPESQNYIQITVPQPQVINNIEWNSSCMEELLKSIVLSTSPRNRAHLAIDRTWQFTNAPATTRAKV